MPIKILPDELASQIAAGEVVERPASVVKELVENALDAGAEHISITIEEGGRKLIQVADNGSGIPSKELALAIARHSTSKLSSSEDLFRISTLGFRGEALSSIGSVSRMTMTSRIREEEIGSRITVEGGKIGKLRPIGAPAGTVIRVEDLFYNVPARLKFLKKDTTERRQIDAFITRYALAYPNVRFHLTQENRTALQTSGNGDQREVLASLYSPDIAKQMLEVNAEYEGLKVTGFASPTSLTRSNRAAITFFVNGRWIQNITLTTALVQAYHTMLMVGRYPMAVIFLEIPTNKVDVNVHPAKAEVRFVDQSEIFTSVQRTVRRALLAYTPVPEINTQVQARWTPQSQQAQQNTFSTHTPNWQNSDQSQQTPPDFRTAAERDAMLDASQQIHSSSPDPAQPSFTPSGVPLLRLVGQIGSAFLVAEGPDGLYLVDQHAAHERVLFERFMTQRKSEIPSQVLLEPVTIELPADQTRLLEEQIPVIEKLGFQVEAFGPNTFKVRAMPALLLGSDPAAALRVLIEDFEEDETPLQHEIEAKIIGRVCKRAAVKAGQSLSPEEQKALLQDLEACQAPRTCPHGRPTMIHLSIDLLEKQFGRKGAI